MVTRSLFALFIVVFLMVIRWLLDGSLADICSSFGLHANYLMVICRLLHGYLMVVSLPHECLIVIWWSRGVCLIVA